MADDVGNPDFCGYLYKQSDWFREWRNRYFILKANKLYFSKSPDTAYHGMIDLKDCISVKSADSTTKKPHSFEIKTPTNSYYMYAEREKIKDDWIGAISRAIVRCSTAYTDEYDDDDDDNEQ